MSKTILSAFSFLKGKYQFKNISRFTFIFNLPIQDELIFKKISKKKTRLLFKVKELVFIISFNRNREIIIYSLSPESKDEQVCYASLPYLGVLLNIPVMHVSGIIKDKKVFLFAGKSGTGKSTIVEYLLESIDARRIADDFIFFNKNKIETTSFFYKKENRYIRDESFEKGTIKTETEFVLLDDSVVSDRNDQLFIALLNNTYNINFIDEIGFSQVLYSKMRDFFFSCNIKRIAYTKDEKGLESIKRYVFERI